MPETTNAPGLAADGVSGDIFGTPSGAAWDAARLIFGDWLELVFTDVGSGSATVLTHVAGYVNFLAYILIVVIMSYVLIAAVIKTASEGKVMGNGWSTVWLPLRTFLACFLIFPVGIGQASTISFIQVAVAWLGMVGSNAADRVSSFVVQNLTKRAFMINTEVQGYQVVSDMTKIAFCASAFNKGIEDSYDRPEGIGLDDFYGRVLEYNIDGNGNVSSSYRDVAINSGNISELAGYTAVELGHKGYCGELKRPDISINTNSPSENRELSERAFAIILSTQVEVYENVVRILSGYNHASTMDALESSGSRSSQANEINNNMSQALAAFFSSVNRYENDLADLLIEEVGDSNDFVDYDRDGNNLLVRIDYNAYSDMGWAYLGAYYTLLSKAIGEVSEVTKSIVGISNFKNPNGCALATQDSWGKKQWNRFTSMFSNSDDENCQYIAEFDKNETVIDIAASTLMRAEAGSGGDINRISAACTSVRNCSAEGIEGAFASSVGRPFFQYQDYYGATTESGYNTMARSFIELLNWGGTNSHMGIDNIVTEDGTSAIAPGALYISDPITFTSNLGHTVVYVVASARFALGVLEGVSEGMKSTGIPVVGALGAAVGAVVQASLDFLRVIIALIYPQAAAMAYFLPLLPSLIWAMAFLSWLLMYAEAIFNAPLAVTLMATPEGEGIAGSRMERKIALLAALILKPTFLVVGLLLSMMMLSIGFVFLNQIFWLAAANVTWRFDPIAVIALITIWFGIITVFMHNVFKIIPTFADNSLEWFLGGIARTFGNDLDNVTSDQFQNSFKGSEELSTGLGRSVGIFGRGVKNSIDGKKNDQASEQKQSN